MDIIGDLHVRHDLGLVDDGVGDVGQGLELEGSAGGVGFSGREGEGGGATAREITIKALRVRMVVLGFGKSGQV